MNQVLDDHPPDHSPLHQQPEMFDVRTGPLQQQLHLLRPQMRHPPQQTHPQNQHFPHQFRLPHQILHSRSLPQWPPIHHWIHVLQDYFVGFGLKSVGFLRQHQQIQTWDKSRLTSAVQRHQQMHVDGNVQNRVVQDKGHML
ncbi:hypothetical protein C5167_023319 [Papaver somniferum]|uniref:Uncharacterized protein n=1 Tax=Papaver somniferum TaxID=3469 RepID=A0A4Y7JPF4_PAPSO|nr:hypothetical protein C5167_023319 [Papaver somniferum]